MRLQILTLSVLVVVLSLSFATFGFTLFQADRAAAVDVVSDDEGLLTLEPGEETDVVFLDEDGALTLDLSEIGAQGLNAHSTLQIGDAGFDGTGVNEDAYSVTNTVDETVDVTIEYELDDETIEDSVVTLEVDDGENVEVVNANEEVQLTLAQGESADIAIQYESGASGEDLSGVLSHEAQ